MCEIIDMAERMTEQQNILFRRKFKRYFLEDLYFYWNLSDDNPLIRKLEKAFGMSLAEYSSHVAKREMTIELMQIIVEIYRKVLKILIRSNVGVEQKTQNLIVEFEQYKIGEK